MKKLLLSLAAVAALGAAASPASAQMYDRHDGGYGRYESYGRQNDGSRADNLERRIEQAFRNREISPYDAQSLRSELRQAQRLEWRYARDGRMSNWERADLDQRYDNVRMHLRHERNDRDYGYGYGGGYRR